MLKIDPDIAISNKKKIIGTRNRIIHGYDKVSDEVLWGIINKSLPILPSEVQEFLEE